MATRERYNTIGVCSACDNNIISLARRFVFILPIILIQFVNLNAQCPQTCHCSPSAAGQIVVCSSSLTSFPVGIPGNTEILSIAPSIVQGPNNIPSLQASDFAGFTNVARIQIKNSGVTAIQPLTFSKLIKLVSLDLSRNKLGTLSKASLSGLGQLQLLDLTDNIGCQLDQDVFQGLSSLRVLRLGKIGLRNLGSILSHLNNLQDLDLHGNNLFRLESAVFGVLTNLKHLDVTFNDLYEVQYGLENQFKNLRSLNLDYNPWRCNCAMNWMKTLPRKFVFPSISGVSSVVCQTPQNLRLKYVVNVPDSSMTCVPANIISCSGPVTVKEGTTILITCEVEGDPFPDITWIDPTGQNHTHQIMDQVRQTTNITVSSSLFSQHHGQWTVIAESFNTSTSKPIDVRVLTTTTIPTTTTTTTSTTSPIISTAKISSKMPTPKVTANGQTIRPNGLTTAQGSQAVVKVTNTPQSALVTSQGGQGQISKVPGSVNPPINSYTGNQPSSSSQTSGSGGDSSFGTMDRNLLIIGVATGLVGLAALTGMIIFAVAVYRVRHRRRVDGRAPSNSETEGRTDGRHRKPSTTSGDTLWMVVSRGPRASLSGSAFISEWFSRRPSYN